MFLGHGLRGISGGRVTAGSKLLAGEKLFRMSSDVKDPAQEFAERVADEWFEMKVWHPHKQLADLIATELRAGGWAQGEDAAGFTEWADLEVGTASAGTNVEIKP